MNFSTHPLRILLTGLFLLGLAAYLLLGLKRDTQLPLHAQFPGKISEILGPEETCLDCHAGMAGFAPAHDPQVIGCSPCHRGNPRAEGKRRAHRDMIAVPGNLGDAFLTCGTKYCHQDIAIRVKRSLMTSMSGVVTVDRFVFGQQDSLTGFAHIEHLSAATPADVHLRHLCASCHLGNPKEAFGPIGESSRGGGCNACHLNYSEAARRQLDAYHSQGDLPQIHPALNLQTGNDKCFGCHSRSGRIATNYEGWHETQLPPGEVRGKPGYRQLADGRIFEFVAPDVHHAAGLECVDCHSSREIMGDGARYQHEEEAVQVHCADCHFSQTPPTAGFSELDQESQKILALRRLPYQGNRFVVGRAGHPLLNVLMGSDGQAFLVSKNTGTRHPLPPPAEVCSRGRAHADLSCSACHTGWAPQCVGCHTFYDPARQAVDLLDQTERNGKWVEYLGEFFPEPPSLGIVETMDADSQYLRQVKVFIPGMIMTLDQEGFSKSEVGSRKSEIGSRKSEVGNRKSEVGSRKSEIGNRKSEIGSRKSERDRRSWPSESGKITQEEPGNNETRKQSNKETALIFHRLFAPAAPHTTTTAGRSCTSCHNNPLALGYGRGQLVYARTATGGRWRFNPEYAPSTYDGLPEDAWTGFLQGRRGPSTTRPNARPFTIAEQRRILTVGACLTCHAGDSQVMIRGLDDFEKVVKGVSGKCVVPEW